MSGSNHNVRKLDKQLRAAGVYQWSAYNTVTRRLFLPEITLKKHVRVPETKPLIPRHIMMTT